MHSHKLFLAYLGRFERPTDCVNALNEALNSNYDLTRLGQWRRGERDIPGIVLGYLLGLDRSSGRGK